MTIPYHVNEHDVRVIQLGAVVQMGVGGPGGPWVGPPRVNRDLRGPPRGASPQGAEPVGCPQKEVNFHDFALKML